MFFDVFCDVDVLRLPSGLKMCLSIAGIDSIGLDLVFLESFRFSLDSKSVFPHIS